MDASDYRKQYAAELEQAAEQRTSFSDLVAGRGQAGRGDRALAETAGAANEDDLAAALAVLEDRNQDMELRVAALRVIGSNTDQRPELIDRLLEVLTDAAESVAVRKAALSALQEGSFQAASFPAKRPEFLAALRSVVDDPDADLRRRALGILAREKDEYAQRRLLAGLEDPAQALVPLAKAIQFLGYDIHAEHYPLLRRIAGTTRNRAAKQEAVRLLAADPSSRELLTGLLSDSTEHADVRKLAAIALQALAPEQFEAQARRIVLEDDEDDQLRATCISALMLFGNPAEYAQDSAFTRRVEQLREQSASPQLKQATTSYLSKYRA